MAKITKRDNFVAIVEMLEAIDGTEDKVEFIEAQIALLDKRKTGERKMTKTQAENVELKAVIAEVLDGTDNATATDVATALDVSVQKASQLLRQMIAEGTVARTEGKGKDKTTFATVADEG
jgi:predicted PP-loop superfamily ATPase